MTEDLSVAQPQAASQQLDVPGTVPASVQNQFSGLSQSELLDRLIAEIERAELAMQMAYTEAKAREWQPIETAPRDQRILAMVDGEVRLCRWGKTSHIPVRGFCLADQGPEDFDLCRPTHWQPLPEPPAS